MIFQRSIEASKAGAQKLYVVGKGNPDKETNVLHPKHFEKILEADPTPTKKYVQVMCKWLVESALKEVKRRPGWYPSHKPGVTDEIVSSPVGSNTIALESAGKLVSSLNVFNMGIIIGIALELESKHVKVKSPFDFADEFDYSEYIRKLEQETGKTTDEAMRRWLLVVKQAVPKHLITHESSTCVIVKLPNYETAPPIVGKLHRESAFDDYPHWCVVNEKHYWEDYLSDGNCFYLLISKKANEYFMVQAGQSGSMDPILWEENGDEIDAGDVVDEIMDDLKIEFTTRFFPPFTPDDVPVRRDRIWLLFLDDSDLDWTGWGVSFQGVFLSNDTRMYFLDRIKERLPQDSPWYSRMADHALDNNCHLLLGFGDRGGSRGDFLEYMADMDGVDSYDLQRTIFFSDDPGSESLLESLWSDYLDDVFFTHEPVDIRFSTRWLEREGVRWNPDYSANSLSRHLSSLLRGSRINAMVEVVDTSEIVYEINFMGIKDIPQQSVLDFTGKTYESVMDGFLAATVFHPTKSSSENFQDFGTFQEYLLTLIKGWVGHQGGKK